MSSGSAGVVVIAGGSGFVGRTVTAAYARDGWELRTIGRSGPCHWGDAEGVRRAVEGADILINLAGRSVNCRYSDRNRQEILDSRVGTTRQLRNAVASAARPPQVWLNASTATIYRHETERPNTEATGHIGEGFSVDVAASWEREFFAETLPRTRRVALRMAIVIGDGSAALPLLRLARLGLGGTQFDGWCPPHRRYRGIGDHPTGPDRAPWHRTHGRQKFSWVHLDDVVRAIRFIADDDQLDGPINIASPHPVDNRTLMRTLRRVVGAPIGLPTQRWMLELGTWAMRTETELVLKSRWVVPGVLTDGGFSFAHPELEEALRATMRSTGRRPGRR